MSVSVLVYWYKVIVRTLRVARPSEVRKTPTQQALGKDPPEISRRIYFDSVIYTDLNNAIIEILNECR